VIVHATADRTKCNVDHEAEARWQWFGMGERFALRHLLQVSDTF